MATRGPNERRLAPELRLNENNRGHFAQEAATSFNYTRQRKRAAGPLHFWTDAGPGRVRRMRAALVVQRRVQRRGRGGRKKTGMWKPAALSSPRLVLLLLGTGTGTGTAPPPPPASVSRCRGSCLQSAAGEQVFHPGSSTEAPGGCSSLPRCGDAWFFKSPRVWFTWRG